MSVILQLHDDLHEDEDLISDLTLVLTLTKYKELRDEFLRSSMNVSNMMDRAIELGLYEFTGFGEADRLMLSLNDRIAALTERLQSAEHLSLLLSTMLATVDNI